MSFLEHFSKLCDLRFRANCVHGLMDVVFLIIATTLYRGEDWDGVYAFRDENCTS